jgi:uncharacterized membrane protein
MEGLPPLDYCGTNYRITPALKDELRRRIADAISKQGVTRSDLQDDVLVWMEPPSGEADSRYVPFDEEAVPYTDYLEVARRVRPSQMPSTALGVYMELVTHRHFQGLFGLSAFAVSITIVLLYFIGRLVTARLGVWSVHKFDTLVMGRVPVVSNVYSSVKQVTDFLFSERTIQYNRVVALEYPRRGIWSMGFVTGDSMLEMTAAAGEPLVAVLVPTSPMPVTGYTMSVPRSEVLDLNITIDQAFQFCISCGVLVPPHQKVTPELLQQEFTKRLASRMSELEKSSERQRPRAESDDETSSRKS